MGITMQAHDSLDEDEDLGETLGYREGRIEVCVKAVAQRSLFFDEFTLKPASVHLQPASAIYEHPPIDAEFLYFE